MSKNIAGFSRKTKEEKIEWLITTYFGGNKDAKQTLVSYWNSDDKLQQLHDEFIENTVSNFYLPLGVAPNFIINQKEYTIPMVIEESSGSKKRNVTKIGWKKEGCDFIYTQNFYSFPKGWQ